MFNNTGCGTETIPGTGQGSGSTFYATGAGYQPGSLSNCVGQNRMVAEGTLGFWYKSYNGPKGRLQIGMQYSYLRRNAWVGYGLPPDKTVVGNSTISPTGIENMWFTSFRYYLPYATQWPIRLEKLGAALILLRLGQMLRRMYAVHE